MKTPERYEKNDNPLVTIDGKKFRLIPTFVDDEFRGYMLMPVELYKESPA